MGVWVYDHIIHTGVHGNWILSFPDFKFPGFWISWILGLPDFEIPRFWVSLIFSFSDLIYISYQGTRYLQASTKSKKTITRTSTICQSLDLSPRVKKLVVLTALYWPYLAIVFLVFLFPFLRTSVWSSSRFPFIFWHKNKIANKESGLHHPQSPPMKPFPKTDLQVGHTFSVA